MVSAPSSERVFWWATSKPFTPAAAEFPSNIDVAVIGGGYTGLAAARELASRGASVAVPERGPLGIGASTRNAGMTIAGLKDSPAVLMKRHGEEIGRQLFETSLAANRFVEELIERERIDCDYHRHGHVLAAWRDRDLHAMEREAEFLDAKLGYKTRVVPARQMAEELGSPLYHGAMVDEHSGGLHPGRYFHGLAESTSRAGAFLFSETEVREVQRSSGGFTLRTNRGPLKAHEVLAATNGYTGEMFPDFRRRLIPLGSYIVVTEPLAPEVAARLIPRGRMMLDSKHILYYCRLTHDGRMLFGGRASFTPTTIERSTAWLRQAMGRVFPELQGIRFDYAWMGYVAFTFDLMPHLGRDEASGLHYALGFCGHGVAMGSYLGSRIGAYIASKEAPLPAFSRIPFQSRFFYRRQPWFLPIAGWWFHLLDQLP
jgi:glycine/D-amino acid oxidase-like deaminating enzyme